MKSIVKIIFLVSLNMAAALNAETRFLYIRHGEVPGNDPSPATYIYTGCQTDDSLTEKGGKQAEECAQRVARLFKNITAIYSSDLRRAKETAELIATELNLETQVNPNLREIDWGCADGQLVAKMSEEWDEIEDRVKKEYPDRKKRWDHLPVFKDAETFNALLKRNVDELAKIAALHDGETVVIVGHGRVLKTLIAHSRDSEEKIPYPPNCGIAEFAYSPEAGLRFIKILE